MRGAIKGGKNTMKHAYKKQEKKKFRQMSKKISNPETDLNPVQIKSIYWRHYW